MASINKVIIIGNLGRDPEVRYTRGGTAVVTLSVATTRKWRDKNTNDSREETEWHRVTVWGKSAEHCQTYLSKGRQVYVEGRLKTERYEQNGVTKYSTTVVAEAVQFLGGKSEGNRKRADTAPPQPYDEPYNAGQYSPDGPSDNIPF